MKNTLEFSQKANTLLDTHEHLHTYLHPLNVIIYVIKL